MTEEERRKRLIDWLDVIYKDVQDVLVDDHVFWEVQAIFKTNLRLSNTPSIFNRWMATGFIQSAALGVRRQADKDKKCVSLHRFLMEVKQFPVLLSRDYVIAVYRDSNLPNEVAEKLANSDYDRLVGHGLSQPNPDQVQAEIDELLTKTDQIHHYVDRRAAHYDERGVQKAMPTFNDLTECLTMFERVIKKYKILATGTGLRTLLPVFQYDWKAIFYFPWLGQPETPDPPDR